MKTLKPRFSQPGIPGALVFRLSLILGVTVTVLMSGWGFPSWAQTPEAGLGVTLALTPQAIDGTGSTPVEATITVTHTLSGGGDVLARSGFSAEPWEFLLVFTGQDGQTVTSHVATTGQGQEDGPPAVVRVLGDDGVVRKIYVQGVESLSSGFSRTVVLPDVRTVYELPPGAYTVQVVIPFQRFDVIFDTVDGVPVVQSNAAVFEGVLASNVVPLAILVDGDSDGWTVPAADPNGPLPVAVDCNDGTAAVNPGATEIAGNGVDDDCNAGTPDTPPVVPATVTITAELFEVGTGTHPGASKSPLVDLPVQLFDLTSTCVGLFGTSWQHFASIWGSSCPAPTNGRTDGSGTLTMQPPPGEYLAIGEYQVPGGETIYVGKNVGVVASGESLTKGLKVIVKGDGQTVPAKSSKHSGSVLWIIEPEYVEWDSTVETYPFIFDSEGDWGVTASVAPPEGFVADHESLSTEVNSTLEAVQFTVTDVGSDWVATEVTYELTHPGKEKKVKKTKVKHKIGVRLSRELAEAKGLTRLGKLLPSNQEQ